MKATIIRGNETNRQRWELHLYVDFSGGATIYLDEYYLENKTPTQRKWRIEGSYRRIDGRQNTIKQVDVPIDVLEEAKEYFISQIKGTGVTF